MEREGEQKERDSIVTAIIERETNIERVRDKTAPGLLRE
jgi:hypothetical protein